MKHFVLAVIVWAVCVGAVVPSSWVSACAAESNFLIGCGSADITGPAAGFPLVGFVKEGRYSKGIHLRQRARAFVVAEPDGGKHLAFVCAELSWINAEIYRQVLERLQGRYQDLYAPENVILSATHTHSGAGGFWRYGADGPLGKGFFHEYEEAIVAGIVSAIDAAHQQLQPGRILVARGDVEDGGAQRSSVAYRNNPPEERALYRTDTDTEMTLLKFVGKSGEKELGAFNWFAVHPTSMTFDNYLISGDSKGYAALTFERRKGVTYGKQNEFVAAFAQSNCGDVTGNLNLNNTGPGKDEFESTRIIGQRQFDVAWQLYNDASEELVGSIDVRHVTIDFSNLTVEHEFTQAGTVTTAAAAYGYSFAAGSTEDGGGHPLFREGMKERNIAIDLFANQLFPDFRPDDRLRELQKPKVILFAPGASKKATGLSHLLPLAICRIGQLVLVVGPAEFTTMAGRRIRRSVQEALGDTAKYIVIAGYSNDYAGYVGTREEYEMQQYEGGHTLFGPWTLAGYQQEYVKLARAMASGAAPDQEQQHENPQPVVKRRSIFVGPDVPPEGSAFGEVASQPKPSYLKGQRLEVAFWTGHPRNSFQTGGNYFTVERQAKDGWVAVATDADWETRCRWQPSRDASQPCQIIIAWHIPDGAESGEYRIVHHGRYRLEADAKPQAFDGTTRLFRVE
ncbi:MAG: neutral/alkaline ceramidase [Planctomycetes bacterium]|nr:neutral/alkaline ceramidase [Planctomycetota bacterium]